MDGLKNADPLGLYIHIPFCRSKCKYCDFNSYAGKEYLVPEYFRALEKEIEKYSEIASGYKIKSIFIGGGTPSIVDAQRIKGLLHICKNSFSINKDAEITIEANPGTLSEEKLDIYMEAGINRISIGLQACQDRLLKSLGRIHDGKEFFDSVEQARKSGFSNINADLIFGLPDQDMEDWKYTLQQVVATGIEHISCYSLMIEEGTQLFEDVKLGKIIPVDDKLDRDMYHFAIDQLLKNGYNHYEISNFAKPGFECVHNIIYWSTGSYIGIGAGAHSYFNNERYNNLESIEEYIRLTFENGINRENIQYIDEKEAMSEFVIMGLRLIKGIDIYEFQKRFGLDIYEAFPGKIQDLQGKGLLSVKDGNMKLTSEGLDFANIVMAQFI